MFPAVLAAFVAGVFLLQQQATLPAKPMLAASPAAIVLGALALHARWRNESSTAGFAAAVLLAASLAAGFAYSGWRAHGRLDVALAPADEGRDIELVGVIAGLPAAMERGLRFECVVEQVVTAGVFVPPRL
jgi:competence protein ComEC